MTCIVATKSNGKVYMGGDAASYGNLTIRKSEHPKVFKNGPYLMGYTSSFRMGQILQYKLDLPLPDGDLMRFMCTDFIDAVRKALKDGGYTTVNNNNETGGNFLVGVSGELFEVDDDFQISLKSDPFNAVGCGEEYALGVLYSLYNTLPAKELLIKALETAEYFSAGVTAPFTIIKE